MGMFKTKENKNEKELYSLPYNSLFEYLTKCFFVELVLGILFGIVIILGDDGIIETLHMIFEMGIFLYFFKIISYKLYSFDKIIILKYTIITSIGIGKSMKLIDIQGIFSTNNTLQFKGKDNSIIKIKNLSQIEIEKIKQIIENQIKIILQ